MKILLIFTRYVAITACAFWLGYQQTDFSEQTVTKIDPNKLPTISLDADSESQHKLENEVAKLTNDLEQAKQSNRDLSRQLALSTAALKPVLVTTTANESRCGILSQKMDTTLYEEAYQNIYSTDFATREKSLKALAQLEIPEAKETLLNVVMNEQENPELRRDVIRTMDWHDGIDKAIKLLHSKDESIKAAVILASQDSHLNETEQEDFERELMSVFNNPKSGDFIQIAAIDYLANKNPARISEINVVSDDPSVTARVNQHIDELFQSSITQ